MQAGLLTGTFTRERAASLAEDDHRRANPEFQGPALNANLALAAALKPVAEKHGVGLGAAAIAWCLGWQGLTGAIVGARSPGQVDGWIAAASPELDPEDMVTIAAAIEEIGAGEGPTLPM